MKKLALLLVMCFFPAVAHAVGGACPTGANYLNAAGSPTQVTLSSMGVTSCFYASPTGVDTATGTDETHPWLHLPGMAGCSNNCSSTTIAAGEGFIIQGGATYHFSGRGTPVGLPWSWAHNGTGANPIYLGVDKTWFSGTSWTRPVFTGDNPTSTSSGGVASCSHADDGETWIDTSATTHVIKDNLEATGMCWNTGGGLAIFNGGGANSLTWTRNYIHGWTRTTGCTASGCAEAGVGFASNNGADTGPGDPGWLNVYAQNVVDGADSDNKIFTAMEWQCYDFHQNYFSRYTNMVCAHHLGYGNTLINTAQSSVTPDHGNTFEENGSVQNAGPNAFFGNFIAHNDNGVNVWLNPQVGTTDYSFDNIVIDITNSANMWNVGDNNGNIGAQVIFNNTWENPENSTVMRCQPTAFTYTVSQVNNHVITDNGGVFTNCTQTITTNLVQTHATATGQGFTASETFVYSPTASTNSTVHAGTNEISGFCAALTSGGNTIGGSACLGDTSYACVYDPTGHSVYCPARVARTRPSAWDIGAYQFGDTYFIGLTGGTISQCDGLTNVPLAGSSGGHCQLSHPYWLMNQSTGATNLSPADIVLFQDVGPYYMGQTLGGHGSSWPFCVGNEVNCAMPSFPGNVKFYGAGVGACSSASSATQLIGLNDVFLVFNLQGTSHPDVECFNITAAQTCTQVGGGGSTITNTQQNSSSVATYNFTYSFGTPLVMGEPIAISGTTNSGGHFNIPRSANAVITGGTNLNNTTPGTTGTFTVQLTGGTIASAADTGLTAFGGSCEGPGVSNNSQNGIFLNFGPGSQGPDDLNLQDIWVHGMSHNGMEGGEINATPVSVTNFINVNFAGNGEAGWDYDSGVCNSDCPSQGTVNLTGMNNDWSGAVEVIPNGGTIGGNGFNYAVDEAYNGSGDGLVMLGSGGTWNWSKSHSSHCMQDCFDFLHLADNPLLNVIVNATNMFASYAEGQTFKLGGKTANGTNIAGIGSCNWPNNISFPGNPVGWNVMLGRTCRASDAMAFAMQDGYTINLGNITNVTDQSVMWDFSPPFGGVDCQTSLHNCTINQTNTVSLGFPIPGGGGTLPGTIFIGTTYNPFNNGSLSHNVFFNNSGSVCPSMPNTTSCTYGDPKFTAEASINAINIVPLAGPLVGTGISYAGIPTKDIFDVNYSSPPPIGAAMPSSTTPPSGFSAQGSFKLSGNGSIK